MDPRVKAVLAKHGYEIAAKPAPVTLELVLWMEATYPHRCYDPSSETLEQHLIYSGKAALTQLFREQHEASGEDELAAEWLSGPIPEEAPLD